jgi:hypothetical protein
MAFCVDRREVEVSGPYAKEHDKDWLHMPKVLFMPNRKAISNCMVRQLIVVLCI